MTEEKRKAVVALIASIERVLTQAQNQAQVGMYDDIRIAANARAKLLIAEYEAIRKHLEATA